MLTDRDKQTITDAGLQQGAWHIEEADCLPDGLLTINQIHKVTGIPKDQIYKWIERGELRVSRPAHGGIYIDEYDFVDCAERMTGYRTKMRAALTPDDDNPKARWVTGEEAEALTGTKRDTIRKWATRGELEIQGRRGNRNLYDVDDICELAAIEPTPELIRKAQAGVSFAIDAITEPAWRDDDTILNALHASQDALEVVIRREAA